MQFLIEKNSENLENYKKPVKEEPIDVEVKNGLFQYQNQESVSEISVSLPTWSFLVSRCHFLLQENNKSDKFKCLPLFPKKDELRDLTQSKLMQNYTH